ATAPECSVTTAAFHVPLGPEAETIAACASSPTALTSTGVTTAGANPGFSTLNTTISAPRNAETNPALFVLGITVTIWPTLSNGPAGSNDRSYVERAPE